MNPQEVQLVQQVQQIVSEQVPEQDYQQQVDRWNRYQEALDKIKRQCEIEGARFHRRQRTSYGERRVRNIGQMIAASLLVASLTLIGYGLDGYSKLDTPPLVDSAHPASWDYVDKVANDAGMFATSAGVTGFFLLWNRGKLPENITFTCKPVINIDDLYYLQRYVIGMSKEKHDPKVVLPELTMVLPQSWIKQNSLLAMMGNMEKVKI